MSDDLARVIAEHAQAPNFLDYCECGDAWPCDVRLVADELATTRTERDEWREWALDADHHPGCSGGYAHAYPCKCGLRDLRSRYASRFPRPERADERNPDE